MAKTIKKIACPQCGSNDIAKHEHDYYVCNSCNTRFFLDTDDVTITHKHESVQSTPPPSTSLFGKNKKKSSIILTIVIIGFILIRLIPLILNNTSKPTREATTNSVSGRWDERLHGAFWSKSETVKIDDKRAVLVHTAIFDRKTIADNDKEKVFVFIHDLPSGKLIKRIDMNVDLSILGKGAHSGSDGIKMFRDSKDHLYFIFNKIFMYRFDELTLDMVDVTKSYFDGVKELEGDLVSITIGDRRLTSFLDVVNSEGVGYTYSRDLNKVILTKNKDYSKQPFSVMLATVLPNPKVVTKYAFTKFNENYSDKPIQLMKYRIKEQKGYFDSEIDFQWFNVNYYDWDKGVQIEKDKFGPSTYTEVSSRILEYNNFTPDRTYATKSEVLGEDSDGVFIAFKASLLDSETYTVQKLKKSDASIVWTHKTDWDRLSEIFSQVNANYAVVESSFRKIFIIDNKGVTEVALLEYNKNSK